MQITRWREIVSGERRGLGASLVRGMLWLLSWGYRSAVCLRQFALDRRSKATFRAEVPVISIGNITAGGTGKTPFAALVARWFRARGVRVCFLSRGYHAGENAVNDEALVLELLCPDVPHLQNPDRVQAARVAVEELDSQLLILDDGFQHRRLARDLDVVLIDAVNPFGYDHLLPRGLLREPLANLRRATCLILTRCDQVGMAELGTIRQRLQQIHPTAPLIETAFPPTELVNAAGETAPLESLSGQRVVAFCGIGHPHAFRATCQQAGLPPVDFREFPDHHHYTRDDVDTLRRWAEAQQATALITTLKDLVKLGVNQLGAHPLWAIAIDTRVLAGVDVLQAQLQAVLDQVPASPDTPFDE